MLGRAECTQPTAAKTADTPCPPLSSCGIDAKASLGGPLSPLTGAPPQPQPLRTGSADFLSTSEGRADVQAPMTRPNTATAFSGIPSLFILHNFLLPSWPKWPTPSSSDCVNELAVKQPEWVSEQKGHVKENLNLPWVSKTIKNNNIVFFKIRRIF
jgi:hypothetical protein